MKAVLLIDMPNNCSECPYYQKADTYWGDRCSLKFKSDVDDYLKLGSGRPSWCPLRPLPKKSEMTDDWRVTDLVETESGRMARCYFKGRNEVIDEITGEEE